MSYDGDNLGIAPPSCSVTFASYECLAVADPFFHPERFLNVPWFAPYYWRSPGLVGRFVSAGVLPGRVAVRALGLPEFYLRFIIPARDLLRLTGESLQLSSCELILVLNKLLRRVHDGHLVPTDSGLDVWAYRSYGESLFGPSISNLDVPTWRDLVKADVVVILFVSKLFINLRLCLVSVPFPSSCRSIHKPFFQSRISTSKRRNPYVSIALNS